ncbi:MAG: methyltransferase domain-containing protein [Deltaproteobacteria bacterium]|nr:methyltransferase domain-containing protein [Deltaproteobacteria bacterium]
MGRSKLDERMRKLVYAGDALSREDESNDRDFYRVDRFVSHLDRVALVTVERVIKELIVEQEPAILDLMAGWDSHLPEQLMARRVAGLGLNRRELQSNPALNEWVVHDLNVDPTLPYESESFDIVLNTVSVAYLAKPFAVFAEVERVLKPGGLFLVIFSDRNFAQKAVRIWLRSGAEERVWIVEDYLKHAGFERPSVFVSQGKARPADDKYADKVLFSDPIYAVYAEKSGGDPTRRPRPALRAEEISPVDRELVEKRKREVGRTLRCPYCEQPLQKWELAHTPFSEWDMDHVYVCFNDLCPYMQEGWDVMRSQGAAGFTYRLMYDPERNRFQPTPLPSAQALKQYRVLPRG